MQLKARFYETLVYLSLRPTNYLFGRIFRSSKIINFPGLGYLVNDAEIARAILHDGEHFSIKEAGGLGDLISELLGTTPTLLSMDGDEHKRVKLALLELFGDDKLPKLIGLELERFTNTLKDKATSRHGLDIVRETRLATNRITMRILGVPGADDKEVLRISGLVTGVMGCVDIKHKTFTPINRQKALGYVADLKEMAANFCIQAEANEDSIIGRLRALGYDNESMHGFLMMFIIAGTVTVSSALPRIIALLVDTNQLAILNDRPELIVNAVDEGLRYTTPGPVLLHGVKKDTELAGHHFKAGSRVMVLLYNVMHSKHYTSKPFAFIASREQNKLINGLWFGMGAHFCMGSVLARKEITAAINALAPLTNGLTITQRSFMRDGINPGYCKLVIKVVISDIR